MLDIYDWILSPEIRDYLRENYTMSVEEKAKLICSGCRPLDEKYEALHTLLDEAESQEDRSLIAELLKLYDWAFEELKEETPGQVFISYVDEKKEDFGGVQEVFYTYDEIVTYMEKRSGRDYTEDEPIFDEDCIEKWEPINGKMDNTITFKMLNIRGKCCITHFRVFEYRKDFESAFNERGISRSISRLQREYCEYIKLPLPFKLGDLVCLNYPNQNDPQYGVVNVTSDTDPWGDTEYSVCMAYMEDSCLKWHFLTDNYPFGKPYYMPIDWLRPITPSELPADQMILAELSDYIHSLSKQNPTIAEERFVQIVSAADSSWDNECPKIPREFKPQTLDDLLSRADRDTEVAEEFYKAAKRLINQIERVRVYDETNIMDFMRAVTDLYSKALYLPNYRSIACDDNNTVNELMDKLPPIESEEDKSYPSMYTKDGFDLHFDKLCELVKNPQDIGYDMYDIYPEIKRSMRLYEHGYVEYALWQWSKSFNIHWEWHIMCTLKKLCEIHRYIY